MPKSFITLSSNRKRGLLYGTAIGLLIGIAHADKVYAACSVAFTGGADIATCSGANGVISALSGSDFVSLVDSASATDIFGNDGDDKLTIINGSVDDDVSGDSGADTIVVGFSAGEVGDDVTGGSGADQITVATNGDVGGDVLGDLGDDTITIAGGSVGGNVAGGSQADTLVVTGGVVSGDVSGDGGNDRITITGGTIGDDVLGGSGNDTITITGGSIGDSVDGGDLNDTISIAGGTIEGPVFGASGNDLIVQSGGFIDGSGGLDQAINGGAGIDTILLTGGSLTNDVLGGDGNDTIVGSSSGVEGDLEGNSGADLIVLTATGEADAILGGSGGDTISLAGGSVEDSVVGNDGDDTIIMTSGQIGDGLGANENGIDAGTGNDQITFSGGTIDDLIEGGDGNDTISISGGLLGIGGLDGDVFGNSGQDTIVVTGGVIGPGGLEGDLFGGADNDQITVDGGEIGANVQGDTGLDTITISGGSIDDNVLGGDGADTLSIAGGTIGNGFVGGGSGDDTIVMTGGLVGLTGVDALDQDVRGDSGNDRITIAGGEVDDDVEGGVGNDTISITGGQVGLPSGPGNGGDVAGGSGLDTIVVTGGTVNQNVFGNSGSDQITVGGGFVGIDVRGGAGSDTITIAGGTVGDEVAGDEGDDTISVAGGAILGDVLGNSGLDTILLTGGSMGDVFGGTGDDTIVVSGLADLQDDTIGGDNGDDTISLHGGDIDDANVLGGSGDDTVDVNGAGGADYLRSVEELFGGTGTNDVALFSAFAGVLSEEFGGFEQVLLLNGTTLDVHNPASASPDDRDLSAGASGTPNILFVDASSTLEAGGNSPGDFTWTGDQANLGLVTMLDGSADDLYTVTGNYAGGAGGTSSLAIDAALDITELGDEFFFGSVADVTVPPPAGPLLVPEGTTALVVQDVGNGIGQLTGDDPGDGIAVIDVSGGSTDSDDFFLVGEPIQAGAVEYSLVLESDNIWYLQSQFLDQVFGYAAAPSAILGMARDYMGNLHERVGSLQQTWTGGATQISDGSGVWLRSGGFFGKVDGGSDFDELDYDQDHWFAQLGADLALLSDASTGQLIASVMGHAGYSTTTHDEDGNTEITKNHIYGYGGGLALTWYGGPEGWAGEGLYIDGIAQVTFYNVTTKTTAEGERGETDGWGWSIGMEAGYGINVGGERGGPRIVPQIQLVYSQVNLDDFTDEEGVIVEFDNADSLLGRLGVAVDSGKMWRSVNAYAEANIVQEFMGDTKVTVTTIPVEFDTGGTSVELGMGGTVSLLDNVNIYADVDYLIPFDNGRQGASVIGGVRISF